MMNFPKIDLVATGNNIKAMRINNNLTIAAMQNFFGFNTPQAILKWQRGDALPTVDNLLGLATLFNTTIDNILVRN